MGWLGQQVAATATSYVVAGNSGICSFLTLFLMGCIERYDEGILNMSGTSGMLLSSTPSLCILAFLTVLEFIAMCVPVVDEITDSAMMFVVPIVSFLGVVGTLGLYTVEDEYFNDDNQRLLAVEEGSLLNAWRIFVVVTGLGLALTMHLFKMLVRLIGLGWFTSFLTIIEFFWCFTTLLLAIFVRTTAIAFASTILLAATWHWRRRLTTSKEQIDEEATLRQSQLDTLNYENGDNDNKENGEQDATSPSTLYQNMA